MRVGVGIAAVLSLGMTAAPVVPPSPSASSHPPAVEVVVGSASPADASAAVAAVGGRVVMSLPVASAVAADVPVSALGRLDRQPGVEGVISDRALRVADTSDPAAATLTVASTPSVYRQQVGADTLAAAGDTGQGAVVALVDTGVTPVPDLAGRLVTGLANPTWPGGPPVDCINFSPDPTCSDGFGHGTFMAGLIAGTGASSGGRFAGVAPGARIINIKVAGANGATDLVRVLAAVQWVVSFHQQYGISVLNLSLGNYTTTDPARDPLDLAVEQAWRSGVAVVVAAGNGGPAAGTITAPGDDPLVITAGAANDRGTPAAAGDVAPPYTSRGPVAATGAAKPDVAAPGTAIIGLQDPGSAISSIPTEPDLQAPNFGGAYRRGSGSSMAAAITSGVAALVYSAWSQRPGFPAGSWPADLKSELTATATRLASPDPAALGAGVVNAAAAAARTPAAVTIPDSAPTFNWTPAEWYSSPLAGNSWEGNSWEGNSWEGNSWEGNSWEGQSWG